MREEWKRVEGRKTGDGAGKKEEREREGGGGLDE